MAILRGIIFKTGEFHSKASHCAFEQLSQCIIHEQNFGTTT